MAARIYNDEMTGSRFQIATRPTNDPRVMRMTIGHERGEPVVQTCVDRTSLRAIRHSGQGLQFEEQLDVHYRVVSNQRGTRVGFLLEFHEGSEVRSLMVETSQMEWLMTDPDSLYPERCLR